MKSSWLLINFIAPYLLANLKYPEAAPVTALDTSPADSKQYNSFGFLKWTYSCSRNAFDMRRKETFDFKHIYLFSSLNLSHIFRLLLQAVENYSTETCFRWKFNTCNPFRWHRIFQTNHNISNKFQSYANCTRVKYLQFEVNLLERNKDIAGDFPF